MTSILSTVFYCSRIDNISFVHLYIFVFRSEHIVWKCQTAAQQSEWWHHFAMATINLYLTCLPCIRLYWHLKWSITYTIIDDFMANLANLWKYILLLMPYCNRVAHYRHLASKRSRWPEAAHLKAEETNFWNLARRNKTDDCYYYKTLLFETLTIWTLLFFQDLEGSGMLDSFGGRLPRGPQVRLHWLWLIIFILLLFFTINHIISQYHQKDIVSPLVFLHQGPPGHPGPKVRHMNNFKPVPKISTLHIRFKILFWKYLIKKSRELCFVPHYLF